MRKITGSLRTERVFIVSVRKDIDRGFEFPEGFPLTKRIKDVVENEIDEKYYLSERATKKMILFDHEKGDEIKISGSLNPEKEIQGRTRILSDDGISQCLTATDYKDPVKITVKGNLYPNSGNPQAGMIYDPSGMSPCLDTCQGGNRMPKIRVKNATKQGYAEAEPFDSINFEQPNSKTRRGRVGKGVANILTTSCNQGVVEPVICASRGRNPENPSDRTPGAPTKQRLEVNESGCSNTLTSVQKDNYVLEPGVRVRKLTPLECFRLMGFTDEEFHRAEAVNSNTQLYRQAGNSIVVDVLVYLFKQIFKYVDLEVGEVKKVEEKKILTFVTDKMIDLAALMESEPELFDELSKDYPATRQTDYVYRVV